MAEIRACGATIPEDLGAIDVCIVGTGPAGLTMACTLIDTPLRILLLECGRMERNADADALAAGAGETIGDRFPDARYTSVRRFGGMAHSWRIDMSGRQPEQPGALTSHATIQEGTALAESSRPYGVRYALYDNIDFERHDWLLWSGWPIGNADLAPYLEQVHTLGSVGPFDYDPRPHVDATHPELDTDPDVISTKLYRIEHGATFLEGMRARIEAAPNVRILLDATVTELDTDDTGKTVTELRVRNLQGLDARLAARQVIVATGAIEATRLLFNSNRVKLGGLGNDHGLLGRFLMDHPVVRSGTIALKDPGQLRRLALYDPHWSGGNMVVATPAISEAVRRREHLLGSHVALFPAHGPARRETMRYIFPRGPRFRSKAVEAAKVLKKALRERRMPPRPASVAGDILLGLPDLVTYSWRRRTKSALLYGYDTNGWSRLQDASAFGHLEVFHFTEQAPDPDNRIVPTEAPDDLGARKVQQYWEWKEIDIRSCLRSIEIYRNQLRRAGLGELRVELDHGVPRIFLPSAHHFMGTTRMADAPGDGVVDRDCKVHGVDNLYVASSSVFPTGSYANPTLTLLALAVRIAERVRRREDVSGSRGNAGRLRPPSARRPRCLIPRFDGVILSQDWREALWDKFVTAVPRPRTPSELQYSDRRLRSRS